VEFESRPELTLLVQQGHHTLNRPRQVLESAFVLSHILRLEEVGPTYAEKMQTALDNVSRILSDLLVPYHILQTIGIARSAQLTSLTVSLTVVSEVGNSNQMNSTTQILSRIDEYE
jgi:hypothetical protein